MTLDFRLALSLPLLRIIHELNHLSQLDKVQPHYMWPAHASSVVPENPGALSRITVSGNGRPEKSRSRMRQTRCPPMKASTSITGTFFEQRLVIVKHLSRHPWPAGHGQSPSHNSAPDSLGSGNVTRRNRYGLLPHPAPQRETFFRINPLDLFVIYPPSFP